MLVVCWPSSGQRIPALPTRDGLRRREPRCPRRSADSDDNAALRDYYAARAPEYDEFLRRPRRAAAARASVCQADLDAATLWLDALPISGEIVELAAGTGLVVDAARLRRVELWLYDVSDEVLDVARNDS